VRKVITLVCVSLVAAVGGVMLGSVGGSAAITDLYARSTSFDHQGVSIHCAPGDCAIPLVLPSPVGPFPSLGGSYDAVITASFTYKGTPGLRMEASPHLCVAGGDPVGIPWSVRPLPASSHFRAVTLTWLVKGLDGTTGYELYVGLGPVGSPSSYDVSYKDMTLAVEGSPT